jgi:hypothetical protein
LKLSTRWGNGSQRQALAALPPGVDTVPIVQEAEWTLGPIHMGAKNLAPTGIRSSVPSARSESLYKVNYTGQHHKWIKTRFGSNGDFLILYFIVCHDVEKIGNTAVAKYPSARLPLVQ